MTKDPVILAYGNIQLLDVPYARAVADEIFVQDCYRMAEIPNDSIVFDIGAFYGEFGLACCVEKNCYVFAYEPSAKNYAILHQNLVLNRERLPEGHYWHFNLGIAAQAGERVLHWLPNHPAGSSMLSTDEGDPEEIFCIQLSSQIRLARNNFPVLPICCKFDCEGAEKEIFEDLSWLPMVDLIRMEWHDSDGRRFATLLEQHGFEVSLEAEGYGRGLLFAKRKA